MKAGLLRAYRGVGVNPDKFLHHLRRAYGLPITSFRAMNTLPLPVVDYLADKTIRASMKMAMLEGAGTGLGGVLSVLPDVGFLGGITWRMIQKLSLIHGFEYASEDDKADLLLAAASAAGVDMGKDLVRKQVIERFVPRIVERIAIQAGGEIAENGLVRLVPVTGLGHGRHTQLLLRARVGTPGAAPFPRTAPLAPRPPFIPACVGCPCGYSAVDGIDTPLAPINCQVETERLFHSART